VPSHHAERHASDIARAAGHRGTNHRDARSAGSFSDTGCQCGKPARARQASIATPSTPSDSRITSWKEQLVFGNSHMMMLDRNNKQIADRIMNWIESHVDLKGGK
jgi:hypothetical protein